MSTATTPTPTDAKGEDLAVIGATMTIDEFKAIHADHDGEVRVLDVRTPGEFESVHIPGSYNVPLNTVNEHLHDLANTHRPVVLVCQSGGRASQAHEKLAGAGRQSIYVLDGGIQKWRESGGDVKVADTGRWAMDRQVRLAAGSMALAAVLASVRFPGAKWLAAGVAGGLVFSAVTDTCAMAQILGKLPYNRPKGSTCDLLPDVLAQLADVEAEVA